MDDFIRRSLGATSRAELASALEASIRDALQPRGLVVWLRRADGRFEPAPRGERSSGHLVGLIAVAAPPDTNRWDGGPWEDTFTDALGENIFTDVSHAAFAVLTRSCNAP